MWRDGALIDREVKARELRKKWNIMSYVSYFKV